MTFILTTLTVRFPFGFSYCEFLPRYAADCRPILWQLYVAPSNATTAFHIR